MRRHHVAQRVVAVVEWEAPHSRVVDKNWEGYLGSEGSLPQTRLHNPGFQCWEDKSPKLIAVKTSGGWGSKDTARFSGDST